jgi:hypothetical protein
VVGRASRQIGGGRPGILAALAGVLIATGTAPHARAESQTVPSTRISVDVPAGFEPAKQFPGFMNEKTGASLMVVQMPAVAYAEFQKKDLAAAMATQGFASVKNDKLTFPGDHIYITAEQATAAGAFSKFLLIFADADATAMLTANVPKADITSGRTKVSDIEKMLQSAKFTAATAAAAEPDFTLGYLGVFKTAGGMAGATMFTLDGKGAPDKPDPGRPVFIVAPSVNKVEIADVKSTAFAALASLFDVEAGKIIKEGPISIAGFEGYEVEFAGPDKAGNASVGYQAFLKGKDGGYVRLVGTAGEDRGKDLSSEFRKMAESYKPKAP